MIKFENVILGLLLVYVGLITAVLCVLPAYQNIDRIESLDVTENIQGALNNLKKSGKYLDELLRDKDVISNPKLLKKVTAVAQENRSLLVSMRKTWNTVDSKFASLTDNGRSNLYVVKDTWNIHNYVPELPFLPHILKSISSPYIPVILVVFALFLTPIGKGAIGDLLIRLQSFKFGGLISMSFSEKASIDKGLSASIKSMKYWVFNAAKREAVRQDLYKDWIALKRHLSCKNIEGFRITVHIPLPFVEPILMQLMDYEDGDNKSGRFFPIRYGILGMAYRTGKPILDSQISQNPGELAQSWGMTCQEAIKASGQTMAAIPLKDDSDRVVAVIYLSDSSAGAISKELWSTILVEVNEFVERRKMKKKFFLLESELLDKSLPELDLYDTAPKN